MAAEAVQRRTGWPSIGKDVEHGIGAVVNKCRKRLLVRAWYIVAPAFDGAWEAPMLLSKEQGLI